MIVLSVIRAVLMLLLVFVIWPLMLGAGLGLKRNIDRYIIGFCATQALFFLIYIPAILMSWSSMTLTIVGAIVITLVGAIGAGLRLYNSKDKKEFMALPKPDLSFLKNPFFDLAIVIVVYQIVRYVLKQPPVHGEDVAYINMITDFVDTNAIYTKTWAGQIDPTPLSEISFKYVFTSYYPFMGMISILTGLHPLILCKTVIPVFYVPIHYMMVWRVMQYIFESKEDGISGSKKISICLFFYALLIEFIQYSENTVSRHLLISVWNSESNCCCLLLVPLFFYTFLFLTEDEASEKVLGKATLFYRQLLITIIAVACISATVMGLIMSAIVMGLWSIIAAYRSKRIKVFATSAWTIIPHIITVLFIMLFTGWTI